MGTCCVPGFLHSTLDTKMRYDLSPQEVSNLRERNGYLNELFMLKLRDLKVLI